MPNCFQLIDKTTGEPTVFQKVDDEMRLHFNQPPDPKDYLCGWYDSVGFRVAIGRSLEQVLGEFKAAALEEKESGAVEHYCGLIQIVQYLMERYDTNAWAERGRR